MFGFIADALTSVTSILLPVFFSYKALRTSDPAVLTPWLMYWTTLSLFHAVESQLNFILCWIPFYSWIRLGVHLYLVLPGQQGSVFIYRQHIHPFLEEHERQIDRMISQGHAQAKAAGMDAVKRAIEYIRVNVLGQPPRPPTPPPSRNVSYTNQLFERFAMPSARDNLISNLAAATGAAGAAGRSAPSDLLGLLGKALSGSGAAVDPTSSRSAPLIPSNLHGEERTDYVNNTRERLRSALMAFDAEASTSFDLSSGSAVPRVSPIPRKPYHRQDLVESNLSRSRSESEFEDLGYDNDYPSASASAAAYLPTQMPDPEQFRVRDFSGSSHSAAATPRAEGKSAGWSQWVWGNYGERDSAVEDDRRKSSGRRSSAKSGKDL